MTYKFKTKPGSVSVDVAKLKTSMGLIKLRQSVKANEKITTE